MYYRQVGIGNFVLKNVMIYGTLKEKQKKIVVYVIKSFLLFHLIINVNFVRINVVIYGIAEIKILIGKVENPLNHILLIGQKLYAEVLGSETIISVNFVVNMGTLFIT